jgi:hypothetical protein
MTTYTWPSDLYPTTSSLTWESNDAIYESPLSGSMRTEARPGSKWVLSMSFTGLMYEDDNITRLTRLETLIYTLNGARNRIRIPDFGYRKQSTVNGTPQVYGSGQTGSYLATSGWPTIAQTVLRAGDRITVDDQMIPLSADAVSNAGGYATLFLAHPMHDAPPNGDSVYTNPVFARYILSDNQTFSSSPGVVKTVSLTFREAVV